MKWKHILAVGALVSATAAPAQLTRDATPGSVPPPASVADLAWMTGEWSGDGFGLVLHENYSAPIGGQMPGHFYGAKDGKPDFYEFVMIAQVGDSIEYRVKHFNPDMTGWEEKDKFIRFPLVAVEKDIWFFDGLTIRRTGPDTAEHVVRIQRKDGSTDEAVLKYWRAGSRN